MWLYVRYADHMRLQSELNQMLLDQIEIFALLNLIAGEESGSTSVKIDSQAFRVIAREKTNAGFYSIIRCSPESQWVSEMKECSLIFDHPMLSRQGVFVCWPNGDQTLCLEAFSCSGGWPDELLPKQLCLVSCA